MSIQSYMGTKPTCPFCQQADECRHFIGWTEDGRTIEPRSGGASRKIGGKKTLRATDVTINTGVTTRVYRK